MDIELTMAAIEMDREASRRRLALERAARANVATGTMFPVPQSIGQRARQALARVVPAGPATKRA